MERVIEISSSKISEIRGYMANSSQDCASGTCDSGFGGGGGGFHMISAEETLKKELKDISDSFFN